MSARYTKSPRPAILAHLEANKQGTAAEIAKAIGLSDYQSIVVNELNAMRTDGLIECAPSGKKMAMAYRLAATPPAASDQPTGPAHAATPQATDYDPRQVSFNEGDRAAALAVRNHNMIAAICEAIGFDNNQPTTDLVDHVKNLNAIADRYRKSDDACGAIHAICSDAGIPCGNVVDRVRTLASGLQDMAAEHAESLSRIAQALRDSGLPALRDVTGGEGLQAHVAMMAEAYRTLRASAGLTELDLKAQAALIDDLRGQVEELQREAMRGATLLSGADRYTATGYLVRAPKRRLRIFSKAEAAKAAAMAAARNGRGRGKVFALVLEGEAVRGAEWMAA